MGPLCNQLVQTHVLHCLCLYMAILLKAVMRYIGYSLGFKQARWGSGFVFLRTTSKVIIYTGEFKVTLFYCISNCEAKQSFLSHDSRLDYVSLFLFVVGATVNQSRLQ